METACLTPVEGTLGASCPQVSREPLLRKQDFQPPYMMVALQNSTLLSSSTKNFLISEHNATIDASQITEVNLLPLANLHSLKQASLSVTVDSFRS